MRPDARAQSAIEILDRWLHDRGGLDRILTQWARNNRFAGSGDRAAIADLVYGAIRRMRSATWVAAGDAAPTGRTLLHGIALLDSVPPEDLFTGQRHAPERLLTAEIQARCDLTDAPPPVRFDYPGWLTQHLEGIGERDLNMLRNRAPLDLRVNSLKSDASRAIDLLLEDGVQTETIPEIPSALRVTQGNRKVARSQAFEQGLIEIQDAGSQQLSALPRAQPGEVIVDLCAGGGGKTLALAAATANKAKILAHDISDKRLSDLPARARRAGAEVEIVDTTALATWRGGADLVFVDAPCSGSGAWRRNADAKWLLTPKRLAELTHIQSSLIRQAADLCKPGGRIVYGTCSLLRVENDERVTDFLEEHRDWYCSERLGTGPSKGTDGFFGALLLRPLDSRINRMSTSS